MDREGPTWCPTGFRRRQWIRERRCSWRSGPWLFENHKSSAERSPVRPERDKFTQPRDKTYFHGIAKPQRENLKSNKEIQAYLWPTTGDIGRQCGNSFKLLRTQNVRSAVLYPTRLSFKENKIKTFQIDKGWEGFPAALKELTNNIIQQRSKKNTGEIS